MLKRHAVIYVPGLGDHRVAGQQLAVSLWRLQGVEPHLQPMRWNEGEPFRLKLDRLLQLIDRLHAEGKSVSLVAASAGASAALHAFAMRRDSLTGLVSICGKLTGQGIGSVHPQTYRANPAFQESMQLLGASEARLDTHARSRILSLHPLADEAVPVAETKLPGATVRCMPVAGHFLGIAYGLTLGSVGALRFLRQQARGGRMRA